MKSTLSSNFEDSFKEHSRKKAIERALMTRKEIEAKELKAQREYEWYSKINSEDPTVVQKLFQKEWPLFERLVENKRDIAKLKKKFSLK